MDRIKNNNHEARAASDIALLGKLGSNIGTRRSTSSSVDGNGTTTNKRKASSLPNETVEYLKAWMMSPEHIAHPYPTEAEKAKIMEDTGIEMKPLTNWFVNNRKRFWKPQVEARLREQQLLDKASQQLCTSVSKDSLDDESPEPNKKPAVVSPGRRGSSTTGSTSSSSAPEPTRPENSTRFPSLRGASPPNTMRTVSVHNSMVSLNELVSSDDDEPPARQKQHQVHSISKTKPAFRAEQHKEEPTTVSETVDVHILRPTDGSAMPQITDVTVLSNVPQERVLRTFENCAVNYRCSNTAATTGKSSPSRRDTEIVRIKKHYLAVYLTETAALAMAMNCSGNDKKRQMVSSVHVVTPDAELPVEQPRRKYRRVSVELWKEACQTANHVYDQELPSLEEAKQLFGYTSS